MVQGMMFGGEGPIMQGTWYNPHTGDAFTVRDSFFEDNQYVVTTTDGRYLQYSQLQNYIQSDMKLEELKQMKATKDSKVEDILPSEVAGLIEGTSDDPYSAYLIPEDDNLINKPLKSQSVSLGNINDMSNVKVNNVMQESSMNAAIIDKALKNTCTPECKFDIIWEEFPKKQLDVLLDVMDIGLDEIIEWYLDKIDMFDLVNKIKENIGLSIRRSLDANDISTMEDKKDIEDVKPVETPNKVAKATKSKDKTVKKSTKTKDITTEKKS